MITAVQKAILLKTVKIVSFDWLEDSLMSKSVRLKPDRDYLMSETIRVASIEKKGRKKLRQSNVKKSCKCTKNIGEPQLISDSKGVREKLQGI